ncbi:DUF4192 domain-containing protein [Arthrobacter sp. 2RAF6]|uniref:DUF4192 domain-containing protein n=1 Tax=Arthrobacter sp. 2RAF6 TaxID=3233002 RepID=UPI003F8ED719
MKELRVSGPADILGFIPHALGFAPARSFVFITVSRGRLGATLRIDAPAPATAPRDYAQRVATYLAADENATGVLLAVYTDAETDTNGRPFHAHVEAIIGELELAGMPLRDAWIITPAHWRNLLCDADCGECEPQQLATITDSHVNAAMVFEGSNYQTPAPEFAPFTGAPGTEERILAAVPSGTTQSVAAARALWCRALEGSESPDEATALNLVANFQHVFVRDMMACDIVSDGTASPGDVILGTGDIAPDWNRVAKAEKIMRELVDAAPVGYRAPLQTLIGWIHFYRGTASAATQYYELALEDTPRYRLAKLLSEVARRGAVAGVAQNPATAYRRKR